MKVWYFLATVTAVFVVCNSSGYLMTVTTITACMCNLVGYGGMIYFLSWMMFHNDDSPMATASAFFTLTGLSWFIMSFFMLFFTNSILPVVILVVCLLATLLLSQQGLPVGRSV